MGLMDFFKKGKEKPVEQPKTNTVFPPPGQTQQTKAAPTNRSYTIKSGDSLSKIAKQYYGNANDWQKIYQANKSKIKDPNLILPGQEIIIP
jgi:nucleoid-associated protein YgaU